MSLCFYSLSCSGEQTGLWLGPPLSISCSDKAGSWPPPTPAVDGPGPPPPGQACVTRGLRMACAAAPTHPQSLWPGAPHKPTRCHPGSVVCGPQGSAQLQRGRRKPSGPTPTCLGTSKGLPGGWQAVGTGAELPAAPFPEGAARAGQPHPGSGRRSLTDTPSHHPRCHVLGLWEAHPGVCTPLGARPCSQLVTPEAGQRVWGAPADRDPAPHHLWTTEA